MNFADFNTITLIDFEFVALSGSNPDPVVCLVAMNYITGEVRRYWLDELRLMSHAPFPTGSDDLVVAYYSSAEWSCFLALKWSLPKNTLDLFTEFRNRTNGFKLASGNGLLGALIHFGLDAIAASEKSEMRELILSGGPYSSEQVLEILNYCEGDVRALKRLLVVMEDQVDLPRALLRGRYMQAVARMERTGVPVDTAAWKCLDEQWESIKSRLIQKVDSSFEFYEGATFKQDRFRSYLQRNNLSWPALPSGALDMTKDTWNDMVRIYPQLTDIHYLRSALSKMKLRDATVGTDGRNRTMLSAFRSITGRNQPSNSRSFLGMSSWLRSLIQAPHGRALAYIDYSQQEIGIAAALSSDERLMQAYQSGDSYLAFAKQAGAVPPSATKESHEPVREQYKQCMLAVQYGMGAESLATR